MENATAKRCREAAAKIREGLGLAQHYIGVRQVEQMQKVIASLEESADRIEANV